MYSNLDGDLSLLGRWLTLYHHGFGRHVTAITNRVSKPKKSDPTCFIRSGFYFFIIKETDKNNVTTSNCKAMPRYG